MGTGLRTVKWAPETGSVWARNKGVKRRVHVVIEYDGLSERQALQRAELVRRNAADRADVTQAYLQVEGT